MREIMASTKAEKIIAAFTRETIASWRKLGIPTRVGQIDLDGKPTTEERLSEIRAELNNTTREALCEQFKIVEDNPRS